MDDYAKLTASKIKTVVEGEFAGWRCCDDDGFESLVGPFYYREDPDGQMRCVFRVAKKHCRDTGILHGGVMMTFADFCQFIIPKPAVLGGIVYGVTTNMSCEFVDAAREGDLVEGAGSVTRAGGSMIFVRGQLKVGDRTLFTFSGTIKRLASK